ncbi:conserved hypothetical protein [Leishmania braziliensis MHOM/BR/75/M2904]|uniref:Uncharacterized protein n=2 Tax=Leishmania braziliensis TaxID=5660 RepID=A4H5E0_LEIBR|nr:conserved hypothetical protein [Leishmania braziliensis MHOM/BR/75/M2904]KAI5690103.1 hypothetical protein MNV84_00960 [Leishmania braziliensis]CAJ2467110.1 unnamed protein product [Leishmania braziliensis]CAJ2467806.1 unnamed protein product [Leishmania braziliensis]CAM37165.1 conserved hypothetical protein [Leishmania braziliensis MHOM/BR/75/M2904]SYZ63184.1 hypothetical_protein [Leishmania braziliensis MHOM/BR/75/M2904]
MFRLTFPLCLSSKQLSHGPLATHTHKQSFRQSKEALQTSRRRSQTLRTNFSFQQKLNQEFGARQHTFAQERRSMQGAAEDLMYDRAYHAERRGGRAGRVYRTAKDRAAEMATARELLHMEENTRRLMKKGRTQRTELFRAQRQWSR